MADYQENVSSCLPFYDLTDKRISCSGWQVAG